MNEDGEIEFVERTADIIKYKAYRVSASEIEAVLQDHPTVIGACVVGIPDPKVGERIKAIVVLKEDAKGVGSTDLTRWCTGPPCPLQDTSLYRIQGHAAEVKSGQTPATRNQGRREEKTRKREKEEAILRKGKSHGHL